MEQGAVLCLQVPRTRFGVLRLPWSIRSDTSPRLTAQEVSRNWSGALVPLFEAHGYSHLDALSGSSFSGYISPGR